MAKMADYFLASDPGQQLMTDWMDAYFTELTAWVGGR